MCSMWPPCGVVNEKIMPEVRKRVARQLGMSGLKQVEIAGKLGVTQAMISRYLRQKPVRFEPGIEEWMEAYVLEIAEMLVSGASSTDILAYMCDNCFSIREKGLLCSLHPVDNCRVCMNLRNTHAAGGRKEVLNDVMEAVSILEGRLSPYLVPEVRINVASALPGAEHVAEVAAIPGRLVEIKGEIKALTRPEFGASQHLAGILLMAMGAREELRGVVNTLFNPQVETVLRRLNIPYTKWNGSVPEGWSDNCLVDQGGYGREPCLYVFGRSAEEAARLVRKISDALEELP